MSIRRKLIRIQPAPLTGPVHCDRPWPVNQAATLQYQWNPTLLFHSCGCQKPMKITDSLHYIFQFLVYLVHRVYDYILNYDIKVILLKSHDSIQKVLIAILPMETLRVLGVQLACPKSEAYNNELTKLCPYNSQDTLFGVYFSNPWSTMQLFQHWLMHQLIVSFIPVISANIKELDNKFTALTPSRTFLHFIWE